MPKYVVHPDMKKTNLEYLKQMGNVLIELGFKVDIRIDKELNPLMHLDGPELSHKDITDLTIFGLYPSCPLESY